MLPGGSATARTRVGAPQRPAHRAGILRPAVANPGRVQQIAGQAGYAFDTGTTVTVSTTVTVPTLQCGLVPVAERSSQPGLQQTLEVGGQYVMVESFCAPSSGGGYSQFNLMNALLNGQPYDPHGFLGTLPGTQIQLSESVDPSALTATISSPSQGFTKTIVVNGSWGGSAFVGAIDYSESANGGVPPYNPVPFASTDVNGGPLGAYVAMHPRSVRQSSVWGLVMQDETSDVGSGDAFTITNSNLTLPTVSVSTKGPVARPTSGTATIVFTVALSSAQSDPAYLDDVTQDGTAIAGTDYDATSGTLAFPAGTTSRKVGVTVLPGEPTADAELDFLLELSNPSYAYVPQGTAGGGRILTGPAVSAVTPSQSDVGRFAPTWTITGSGFTGATAVGFYSGSDRLFHENPSNFSVNADGTQIATHATQEAGLENLLHEEFGDQSSYALDVRVSVGDATSVATPADVITLNGPMITGARPGSVDLSVHPGPAFTLNGSGFTGATSVGFYTGTTRHFHIVASHLTVNADGTKITTANIDPTAIAQILQEDLGDPPWVLDVRASTGAITSNAQTITVGTGPVVSSVTPAESDVGRLAPTWTITGSRFTGATAVGFYSGSQRLFHLNPSKFAVSADGTQITTHATEEAGIENILHEEFGDQSRYTLDVRVTVDGFVSAAGPTDVITLDGPQLVRARPASVNLAHHPGPIFTLTGSGLTGATSIGFFTGSMRHFRFTGTVLEVSPDGTRLTTSNTNASRMAQILQEDLGDAPWVLDVRVSTGAITSNAETITFTNGSAAGPQQHF